REVPRHRRTIPSHREIISRRRFGRQTRQKPNKHWVSPKIQSNASYAAIGGGYFNTVQSNAVAGTIGGGYANTNSGFYGTVPGGDQNVAGISSFAAGHRAKAT